jgi:hypothetical protein
MSPESIPERQPTPKSDPHASCQECGVKLAPDSPDLRLEITCDDELLTYCKPCWEREFGEG